MTTDADLDKAWKTKVETGADIQGYKAHVTAHMPVVEDPKGNEWVREWRILKPFRGNLKT